MPWCVVPCRRFSFGQPGPTGRVLGRKKSRHQRTEAPNKHMISKKHEIEHGYHHREEVHPTKSHTHKDILSI